MLSLTVYDSIINRAVISPIRLGLRSGGGGSLVGGLVCVIDTNVGADKE